MSSGNIPMQQKNANRLSNAGPSLAAADLFIDRLENLWLMMAIGHAKEAAREGLTLPNGIYSLN